jgi:hypothetical protein
MKYNLHLLRHFEIFERDSRAFFVPRPGWTVGIEILPVCFEAESGRLWCARYSSKPDASRHKWP